MKLAEAINDLVTRTQEILAEEEFSSFMLERVYRIKGDIIDPAVRTLRAHPKHAAAADTLQALYSALEEYVVTFQMSPRGREDRRHKVEGLISRVRRELLPAGDRTGEVEQLLDDVRKWQVKTTLDANGRLVYATPTGKVVPPRDVITQKAGPQVIDQAVKAQRPYADKMRPRDVRGEPGGLLVLNEGERAIVVGDLHGRYDNLEYILKDKTNLRDILDGTAHLIFTGDAVHPRSATINNPEAYEDSFCVMLLIMTLKAENPFNVHYLIGNHDNAHVGGLPAGRGQVRQDELFEAFILEKFGRTVFDRYCDFVTMSPVSAKLKTAGGHILLVHAGLSPRILNEGGLINILVKGRQSVALQDLLWSRNYESAVLDKCMANVGVKFIVAGHTTPTTERAQRYGFEVIAEGVAGHVHQRQIILSAQHNMFGYLDVDMKRPLPERITDLIARDGRPAFRIMKPKVAPKDEAAETPPAAATGTSKA